MGRRVGVRSSSVGHWRRGKGRVSPTQKSNVKKENGDGFHLDAVFLFAFYRGIQ